MQASWFIQYFEQGFCLGYKGRKEGRNERTEGVEVGEKGRERE